jgi:hypothetical protein
VVLTCHNVVGKVFSNVLKDWSAAFFRIQQPKYLALAFIYTLFTSLPFPVKWSYIATLAITLRPCPVPNSNIHQRFATLSLHVLPVST